MSTTSNKAIVQRIATELMSGGNEKLLDEIFVNPDQMREHYLHLRATFANLNFTIEESVAEGELVATRFTASGVQVGPLGPLPPTGRQATWSVMVFNRLVNDKVVDFWIIPDMADVMRQLTGAAQFPQVNH